MMISDKNVQECDATDEAMENQSRAHKPHHCLPVGRLHFITNQSCLFFHFDFGIIPNNQRNFNLSLAFRGTGGLFNSDHADLNIHKLWQGRNLYRFPGWKFTLEIFTIDFVHLAEAVHICQEDGRFHHMTELHAGFR